MLPTKLTMTRGDSQDLVATFRNAAGTLYDINGWTTSFIVKADPADVADVIHKDVVSSASPSLGVETIPLLPADTATLDVKGYWFALKVLTGAGSVYTVLKGEFVLEY